MLAVVSTIAKGLNTNQYPDELKKLQGKGFLSSSILSDFVKQFPSTGVGAYSGDLSNQIRNSAVLYVNSILGYSFSFPKSNQKLIIKR